MSLRVFSPGVEWLLESALWLLQCILVRLFFLLLQGFRVRWQWISLVIHVVEHKKNVFSVSSVLQLLNDNTEESHLLIPTSLYSGLCQLGHQPLCIWVL